MAHAPAELIPAQESVMSNQDLVSSKEQLRAKMRRLQQSWAKARALQQGSPDVRRDGDAIHTEALALENEIVDRLSHEPCAERMAEPPALTGYAERQLDAIDASVFSGDTYASEEGRARFAWFMGRWCRELDLTPGMQPSPTKEVGQ